MQKYMPVPEASLQTHCTSLTSIATKHKQMHMQVCFAHHLLAHLRCQPSFFLSGSGVKSLIEFCQVIFLGLLITCLVVPQWTPCIDASATNQWTTRKNMHPRLSCTPSVRHSFCLSEMKAMFTFCLMHGPACAYNC